MSPLPPSVPSGGSIVDCLLFRCHCSKPSVARCTSAPALHAFPCTYHPSQPAARSPLSQVVRQPQSARVPWYRSHLAMTEVPYQYVLVFRCRNVFRSPFSTPPWRLQLALMLACPLLPQLLVVIVVLSFTLVLAPLHALVPSFLSFSVRRMLPCNSS